MTTAIYHVTGMTCAHCVGVVGDGIVRVDGVSAVEVDLASGEVTVISAAPVDDGAVRTAIDEAGYEVAS